jgi:hypothetical protein
MNSNLSPSQPLSNNINRNPAKEIIYQNEGLLLTVNRSYSEETVLLLKKTIYGTSGPRYQHTGQENKLPYITDPYFFELWKDSILIGTYCLSGRIIQIGSGEIKSYYGRYLAVDTNYAGKGFGNLLKLEAVKYIEQRCNKPHIFYSYLEESNERSVKISRKNGFVSIANLEALIFSRLNPKMEKGFSQLEENEKVLMLQLLHNTYSNHTFVHFNGVFYQQNYFVLKEKGEIIAGIQANPVLWRMVDMPGTSGKFILKVLPHLPIVRRLINPKNYEFVALEAAYLKHGYEDRLILLIESVLHLFGFTSALILLDVHSPINQILKNSGKLGLLQSLKKNIYTQVMVKPNAVTLDQVKKFSSQPLYVSAFDFS